jgi:RimJ/RimL family protein N-acetyltransferase
MTLRPLSLEDMEPIRQWRNASLETLRTPFPLTREQQEEWYRTVICDRRGTTRYWGLYSQTNLQHYSIDEDTSGPSNSHLHGSRVNLIGYGGIENIQYENRLGEISILIAPEYRGKGYGTEAVELFLRQAFKHLNLANVWGECYTCSPAVRFWERLIAKHGAFSCRIPARKYWEGNYWPSLYFNFTDFTWVTEESEDVTIITGDGKHVRTNKRQAELAGAKEYGDA